MAYQSLYRRYRPGTFAAVKGQDHVVRALSNAARDDRVAHAYLFSGPRGTGKTSTARILAKVLNCANPADGEPDDECESCRAIDAGSSLDVHELDAASNRGIDDIRDLIASTALGSPGRTKLYILDEAHMLTPAASAALLKTLEEPPGHVVFVLATTDPQKVLPTIRSRTQHLEFNLLAADELEALVRWVIDDAGLEVDDDGIAQALRAGGGSARDTLSALDRILAAGGVADDQLSADSLLGALAERDTGAVLVAVGDEAAQGREPRVVGEALLNRLRDAFLASMKADLSHLSEDDRDRAGADAEALGPPMITRSMEALGDALVDMREAPDPRIPLEVALVRITRPDADPSPAALLERIERLERAGRGGSSGVGPRSPDATGEGESAPPERSGESPVDQARRELARIQSPDEGALATRPALGAVRGSARTEPAESSPPASAPAAEPEPQPSPEPVTAAPPAAPEALPSRDALTLAWGDAVLEGLKPKAKALFAAGRFVEVRPDAAVFALPNQTHCERCEALRGDVEAALGQHFKLAVPLALVVDPGPAAPAPGPGAAVAKEEVVDLDALTDAPADTRSGVQRLTEAFPGAEIVEQDS